MFGIGFPELIVILVVALLVVGPDKLPDLARSMAKWTVEMKRTVNELKDSLTEEGNAIGSAHPDDLKGNRPDTESRTWQADTDGKEGGAQNGDVFDMEDFQPPSSEELSNATPPSAAVSSSETLEPDPPSAAVSASETPATQAGSDKNKVAPDDSHPSPA